MFNGKKMLVSALAAAMLCATAVPAFAADPSMVVKGTYSAEAGAKPVVAYGYTWDEDLAFTYHPASKGDWDPETHTYQGGSAEGAWEANGNTELKVVNHSNVAVDVTLAWKSNTGFEDVSVGATDPDFTLETAEGTEYDAAPSKTVNIGVVEGALDEGETDVAMGTLTLMVRQATVGENAEG